jgi:hypothetical protein
MASTTVTLGFSFVSSSLISVRCSGVAKQESLDQKLDFFGNTGIVGLVLLSLDSFGFSSAVIGLSFGLFRFTVLQQMKIRSKR